MAIYVQPYNPWREQLAANIITPLIGDFLTNMRQNEQNKKTNAFRGALQDAISSQSQPVSLTPQNVPDGYNSDGWASAFHKTDTPLTQFDLGTAQPKTPSIQDIAQAANSLAATKRFSMLNPETVQGIKNNMLQMAEAQRLRDTQDLYTNLFRDANSFDEQMKILAQAGFNGVGSPQMALVYNQWGQHRTPHMISSNIDAGDRDLIISTDPTTGQVVSNYSIQKGLDPAEAARNATSERNATIAANASMYNADRSAGASMYHTDATTGLGYAQLAQTTDENRRKETNDQIKVLEDQKRAILESDYSSEQKNAMIAPINEDIARLRSSLTGGTQQNNPQWTIGEAFIGGANNGVITGDYLEQRKGHMHQGIDLPVKIGTPVTFRDIAGQGFTVANVGNQGSKGYGTYVDIIGTKDGHKVEYRLAHLTPGSVRFKPGDPINVGDIIANSGNSGNSSGPHLHIECKVDGKKVNPHTMLKMFQQEQKTQTASAQAKAQKQDATQTQSPLTGHPYFISPEGDPLSYEKFSEWAKEHEGGEAGLFYELENKAWIRDTRDNYDQPPPKLDPAPVPRKPITLPADGDMRYSYMRPSMNTATPAIPPITQQPVSNDSASQTPYPAPMSDPSPQYHGLNRSGLTPYTRENSRFPAWSFAEFANRINTNSTGDSYPTGYNPRVADYYPYFEPPRGLGLDSPSTLDRQQTMFFPRGYFPEASIDNDIQAFSKLNGDNPNSLEYLMKLYGLDPNSDAARHFFFYPKPYNSF